jgi:uncharacterized ion transporter superfamily protein YfcC
VSVLGQATQAAEVAKAALEGAQGRTDAIYLAVLVLVIGGVAFVAGVTAICYWLPRHVQKLMDNCQKEQFALGERWSREMDREREFHAVQVQVITQAAREGNERMAAAVDRLTNAIDSKRRRSTKPSPPQQ